MYLISDKEMNNTRKWLEVLLPMLPDSPRKAPMVRGLLAGLYDRQQIRFRDEKNVSKKCVYETK